MCWQRRSSGYTEANLDQDDKARIDQMTLKDMEHVVFHTPVFSWPFKDADTGEYFLRRYDAARTSVGKCSADRRYESADSGNRNCS